MDIKKLCRYPHNGYPTDMDTCTGQIFIQRVWYEGATTRSIPALLTSLHMILHFDWWDFLFLKFVVIFIIFMYFMYVYVWDCNWLRWNYWYVNMKMRLRMYMIVKVINCVESIVVKLGWIWFVNVYEHCMCLT